MESTKEHYDCIIIGTGPAGLMAGIKSAELGKKTLILEKMHHPGLKLLLSGKGRCNITNIKDISNFVDAFGKNGKFLYGAFSKFFSKELLDFFEIRGVKFNIERGGRVFPESNTSSTILNCLLGELKKLGVKILTKTKVTDILIENNKIRGILINNNASIETKSIIIACGGVSYPETGSDGDGYKLAKKAGHTIIPPKPSLVGLTVKENFILKWQGVNLKNVKISLFVNEKLMESFFGEMIFTHFGISGPIILTASKIAISSLEKGSKVHITLDLKPALAIEQLDARLLRDFKKIGLKVFKNYVKSLIPLKMTEEFVRLSGITQDKRLNQITQNERTKIINLLKTLKLNITGSRPIEEAIVTSGGVATNEISPKTMESKLIKGLFFAGEVIDIDAITGGYNLQAAFSTGYIAGENA